MWCVFHLNFLKQSFAQKVQLDVYDLLKACSTNISETI